MTAEQRITSGHLASCLRHSAFLAFARHFRYARGVIAHCGQGKEGSFRIVRCISIMVFGKEALGVMLAYTFNRTGIYHFSDIAHYDCCSRD